MGYNIIWLIVGFLLLIKGASIFVDGISATATNIRIPKIIIALTIVAFGTSSPELAISIQALRTGAGDVVLANVMGSTIFNTMLIIGLSAIIAKNGIRVKSATVKKELPIHSLTIIVFALLFLDNLFDANVTNQITRTDGLVLIVIFMIFVQYIIQLIKHRPKNDDDDFIDDESKISTSKAITMSAIGLIAIVFGSEIAVNNAVSIADTIGVSQKVITMVILVIGTSMPELVLSVVAARKKEYDIILGNIIGTNIFNICIVLGLPVVLLGNVASTGFGFIDMIVMVAAGLLVLLFANSARVIRRKEGILMLLVFVAYYTYILIQGVGI